MSDGDAALAYAEVLDRCLEDRRLSEEERQGLAITATSWGLTRDDVITLHRKYLGTVVRHAVADRVVTDAELEDLICVTNLLGIEKCVLTDLLGDMQSGNEAPAPPASGELRGTTVCFTGESQCFRRGQRLTRELSEDLARDAGLVVLRGVTKKLQILVVADPESLSAKAR